MSDDTFRTRADLTVGSQAYEIFRLDALPAEWDVARLPYSLKVLLENLVRNEDGVGVGPADIEALARWEPTATPATEIAYTPARVLMQDFTGVPAVVDLAAMRDAMRDLGGDPAKINPLAPAELVIDHSVVADVAGVPTAFARNAELEFSRNAERYEFLRWGQQAFEDFRVVPPDTGIVHQVNLEYLATVVADRGGQAFPDTLVGTDSHTPMVNGVGVLGWGVGGIEAEAAMLGQPVSMLIPQVVGFRLTGELGEGATATDLVLTVTETLRRHGVVGRFVEFYGPGVTAVPVTNRATIGNMSPEYGSTVAMFPVDARTLEYLRFTGRSEQRIALVEAYARAQGMFHTADSPEPVFSETLELDLSTVEPSLAGPRRPQDRVPLSAAKTQFRAVLPDYADNGGPTEPAGRAPGMVPDTQPAGTSSRDEASIESFPASDPPAAGTTDAEGDRPAEVPEEAPGADARASNPVEVSLESGERFSLDHGAVVIAAITSCTNTSNPSVMVAAGLLAKNAVERGLQSQPWVKTSLAPGSRVVSDYYERAGLTPYLEKLRFHLVGYGCTTCIGNSGPLASEISTAVADHDLAVAAVLSGNRNFEGRINPDTKLNYLASPPLVVAYALAGSMDVDLVNEPLGTAADGTDVYLRDIWPSAEEVEAVVGEAVSSEMFSTAYDDVFTGDERWRSMDVGTAEGGAFAWDPESTYVRRPPYFEGMSREPAPVTDVRGARVLALLGDSVTTDHISPAGVIRADGPAGEYLQEQGVERGDFNSYGSRRGNHEVMIRGTFANIRLRNRLAPGTEGGVTRHLPSGEQMSIYDAAMRYADEGVPLVVLAGTEYGSGSSRDWAAKGTRLLGVRAVIAQSYERIHRSNLIGMGVLPLQFADSESVESLGLSGEEELSITGLGEIGVGSTVTVSAGDSSFEALVRIDTPNELEYYRHGGILPYVLRSLLGTAKGGTPAPPAA